MMTRPFAVNLRFTVLPERRADFLNLVKVNQRLTLDTEPEALQYVVGEDTSSPNTFYLHEQFTSYEGFLAHRDMPHAADWARFKESQPFAEGGSPKLDSYFGTHAPEVIPVRDAFCLNVELCIKPEVREEFLECIANNARGSNEDEPLCLQYIYGESKDEPNTFYFHEQYTGVNGGKEGFDAHTATPHFAAWEKFASTDPFTKPPVVSLFRTL